MRTKQILILAVCLGVLAIAGVWVFAPTLTGWTEHVWRLLKRPELLGRIGYMAAFIGGVVFLAVKVGKSGPL